MTTERERLLGALGQILAGADTAPTVRDTLRALPHLDNTGRARVARRITGTAVLRLRLAFLAGSDTPEALLDAYVRTEEDGALPPDLRWPTDPRERLVAQESCPRPLLDLLVDSLGEDGARAFLEASNRPGPRVLRANTLKGPRDALQRELAAEGLHTQPLPLSPWALEVDGVANLFGAACFRQGRFEVQDAGSQWVALATDACPGQVVVDLCAGRGGKTLALAAMMEDRGVLWVDDIDDAALCDMAPRVARAGVTCVRPGVCGPGEADLVLVDAPCSSVGVLRRWPDLRYRFNPEALATLATTQLALLTRAATLVRPGGRVVYATCSVLGAENHDVVARAPATLTLSDERTLLPHIEGCDGFFVARFSRVPPRC